MPDSTVITCSPAVAALAYAVAGWPVLPLHTPTSAGVCSCRRAGCASAGKHPRTRHGLTEASTDPPRVAGWWARWPDANIGILTGRLVVLDVDGPTGRGALAELEAAHEPLPLSRRARTARGEHVYFLAASHQVANSAGRLAPGLDVRGRGGYVVAPPSLHASGHHYTWTATDEPAPLPAWLANALSAPPAAAQRTALPAAVVSGVDERARRYLQAALDAELADVAGAPVGTRNATLNRAAFRLGQLAAAALATRDALARALVDAGLHAGLGEPEARATAASGLAAGERHPRPLPGTQRSR